LSAKAAHPSLLPSAPPQRHDTTSTSLTQLLPLLEAHPEVVDKLREEQRRLVAQHGPGLTLAHMKGMTYADAVIRWAAGANKGGAAPARPAAVAPAVGEARSTADTAS
jgi:hypothetical protein